MARNVIFEGVPTVAPTGAPDAYQHIGASPEAFGAATGRAMESLGTGIERVGETALDIETARQTMRNEIHASETNTWLADQITDKHAQFAQLRGKPAMDALPKYKADLDELYQQSMQQAPSLQERTVLSRTGRALTTRYYGYGTNHANTEMRTWADKTAMDRASTFGNMAAVSLSQGDEPGAEVALKTSDDEIAKLYEQRGFDQDAIRAEVARNRGKNVKALVDQLAIDSPVAAQDFFKKHQPEMDAASQAQVIGKLRGAHQQIIGREIADEETGHVPPAAAPIGNVPSGFIAAVKASEGYRDKAYWDVKQHSIGYGTRANHPGEVIDRPEADRRFDAEFSKALAIVDSVNPNLDAGTRAAMASLTYNAGSAWVTGGLGDKIRAGDIVGARQNFMQYVNAGGVPNPALQARRYREAQWFGSPEPPPGAAPLTDKATAYERVLSRTNDNPAVQNAAVARLNQIYSVYHSREVVNNSAFDARFKDSATEALVTGKTANPLTESEFVNRYGVDEGLRQYGEYQKTLTMGADIAAVAPMSDAEHDDVRKRYAPQPGAAGYAQQLQRYQQIDDAINKSVTARNKDPGQFAVAKLPAVTAAYQTMSKALSTPGVSPAEQKAAIDQYAITTLAEQKRVGVLPENYRLMPEKYLSDLGAKLNNPASITTADGKPGTAKDAAAMIAREMKMWGEHWPMIYGAMAKNLNPLMMVIGTQPEPSAALALIDNAHLSTAEILKDNAIVSDKTITAAVQKAFQPFALTMAGSSGQIPTYNAFRSQAEKLAAVYTVQGMDAEPAATKAYQDLIGHKYDLVSGTLWNNWAGPGSATYRVPKDVTAPKDGTPAIPLLDIESGAMNVLGGMSADIRRDGHWATAPGDSGLILVTGGQVFKGPDGRGKIFSWRELADRGVTPADQWGPGLPGAYDTKLTPDEETKFQAWKAINAPNDSGDDYDLRGAFRAGLKPDANAHWPDTYKKPNHPTFSVESIYAKQRPDIAGRWEGETFVPARK